MKSISYVEVGLPALHAQTMATHTNEASPTNFGSRYE